MTLSYLDEHLIKSSMKIVGESEFTIHVMMFWKGNHIVISWNKIRNNIYGVSKNNVIHADDLGDFERIVRSFLNNY